jgi:hypothetical protein
MSATVSLSRDALVMIWAAGLASPTLKGIHYAVHRWMFPVLDLDPVL